MKKIFTILSIAAVSIFSAQNLVVNGSFETGSIEPWVKGGTGATYKLPKILNNGAYAGTYYASYDSNPGGTTGFMQDIAIESNTVYTLSFWYKATGDGTDGRIWSLFKDSKGDLIYYAGTSSSATDDILRGPKDKYLAPATTWTQHTATFTSPAAATVFQYAVRAYNNSTNVSFDDFVLVKGENLSVSDIKGFDKAVQFNTIVKDQITFKLPTKSTVNIFTVDGKLVSSNRVDNGGSVNTQSLVKGTYIVTVDNGVDKISRKVIKN